MNTFENFEELAKACNQFVLFLDKVSEFLHTHGATLHMNPNCIWVVEEGETVWEIKSDEFDFLSNEEAVFLIFEDLDSLMERYK